MEDKEENEIENKREYGNKLNDQEDRDEEKSFDLTV